MQISFIKITVILVLSSLIGLAVNFLSTRGIPLLREEQKLTWASDSLINSVLNGDDLNEKSTIVKAPDDKVNEKAKEPSQVTNTSNTPKTEEAPAEPVRIDIETALKLYNNNIVFVDARPNAEFVEGHIKGAINISYYSENLEEELKIIDKEKPVVVYCSGPECDLSDMLGHKMFKMGYRKVFVFFGGWENWSANNYPAETQELN